MDAALDKLRARPAAEVCAGCDFETDVAGMLAGAPDAATLLQALLDAGACRDAVRCLCHALQPREAVWLAWDVANRVQGEDGPDAVMAALAATSAWLVEPNDELRRAAQAAAERCGLDQPAGCAALATFFAEGSLSPAELEPEQQVPVPVGACAKAAVGALLLAAVRDPVHADARAADYVARWFELAATEPPWQLTATGGDPAAESDHGPPPDDGGYDTNLKL